MKLDLVQCLVTLSQDGSASGMTIIKSGPGAVTPPEIAILQILHNTEGFTAEAQCVSNCSVVGSLETTKEQEVERLAGMYGAGLVTGVFGRGTPMVTTLKDLELPDGCMAPVVKKTRAKSKPPKTEASAKPVPVVKITSVADLRKQLLAAEVEIPPGNLSADDLSALATDAGLEAMA